MTNKTIFFLAGLLYLLLLGCNNKKITKPIYWQDIVHNEELSALKSKPERLKQQLLGHFSNARHLVGDEREQEMMVIPIFRERTGEFWMYMEFFSPAMIESPIGRGVQNLIKIDRDTLKIETYFFKTPQYGINEWKKDKPFEGLTKEDLIRAEACDYWLLLDEDQSYIARAVPLTPSDCPVAVNVAAVKYSQVQYDLSDKGYNMCIQFFDANQKLLKDCPKGGILFERLDYTDKNYRNLVPADK